MNLSDSVGSLPKIGPIYEKKLIRLDIKTIGDLAYYVPKRYLDFSLTSKIARVRVGDIVSVAGTIVSLRNQVTKRGSLMQIGSVEDETGKLTVVWFNQQFLSRILYPGKKVSLAGEINFFGRVVAMISPEYEVLNDTNGQPIHTKGLIPVYSETSGVSSKWIRTRIKDLIENKIEEDFPLEILKRYDLENIQEALSIIHFPKNLTTVTSAKKRLAFEEVLKLHLESLERKINWQKNKSSPQLKADKNELENFKKGLDFELTNSQKNVTEEILKELSLKYPMNRLLQGDVGSGKTVVAAIAAFTAFLNGYQTIIMAPTQILAQQHFKTLGELFKKYKLRLSLVTGSAKITELGRSDIFIGTHALIQKKVKFERVGLIVIDEQHRFGVEQRNILTKKTKVGKRFPHVLTMTATPIPRTIALTFYGDLDLSILTELPKNRQKITTWVIAPEKRKNAYSWIAKQIQENKSQAFFVCPLIEESESESLKSVKSAKQEFEELKLVFPKLQLGLIHGKMKSIEKDVVLEEFRNGKIDILVATPVVEVGIDIPNATIIVIETAERFGLAQLHQLRGRVGRGTKKSYCLLFSENENETTLNRLELLSKTNSGFELSELDLKLRGPGEIFGTRQHGLPELKIASWQDIDLIKETRGLALEIKKNPEKFSHLLTNLTKKVEMT